MTKKLPAAPTWDLDAIFPGGVTSKQFTEFCDKTKTKIAATSKLFETLPESIDESTLPAWVELVSRIQELYADLELVLSFPSAHASANTEDSDADQLYAEGYAEYSKYETMLSKLEALSLKQSEAQWGMLTSAPKLADVKFFLDELADIAKSKMPVELESLALELGVDGYHGWNRLYDKMAGELKVDFEENGETTTISLGQLATKMPSPDRNIRRQAFEKMTQAWESREELAGMTLNNQAGFRLALYKRRGWDSALYEPLKMSRLQENSLDAMWRVIERETPRLGKYIDAKKKLLGIDKFTWYDAYAPCGSADATFSFDEGSKFVVDNLGAFSSDMAKFCQMAIDKRWVEAEDRPNKRGGAFCTGTGPFRETRVFMTYNNNYDNLLTLAHELGHAYHGWVLRDRPFWAAEYPMTLAETASTFAETAVTDAALGQTNDSQMKLMLLDQKLQAAYTMFTDLYSRFLFDRSFYIERANGVVSTKSLRKLMINAQKKAFGDLLDESGYHPLFWCSKLHFYITDAPFYNFPYVFGFLFSAGVYDRARKEGAAFADKYKALLADTGSMTCEDVAKKHLGVDLTGEDFWKDAVDLTLSDIDEFVRLAESV